MKVSLSDYTIDGELVGTFNTEGAMRSLAAMISKIRDLTATPYVEVIQCRFLYRESGKARMLKVSYNVVLVIKLGDGDMRRGCESEFACDWSVGGIEHQADKVVRDITAVLLQAGQDLRQASNFLGHIKSFAAPEKS